MGKTHYKTTFGTRLGLLIIATIACCVFMTFLNLNLSNAVFIRSHSNHVPDYGNLFKNNPLIPRQAAFSIRVLVNKNTVNDIRRNKSSYIEKITTEAPLLFRNRFFIHPEWIKENVTYNITVEKQTNTFFKDVHTRKSSSSDNQDAPGRENNTLEYLIETGVQKQQSISLTRLFNHKQSVTVSPEDGQHGNSNGNINEQETDDNSPFDGIDEIQRKATFDSYRKHIYRQYYKKIINQGGIECSAILQGDSAETEKARYVMQRFTRHEVPTGRYERITNCNNFIRTRGYINDPLSESEKNFPLAFSLIVYRDIEQVERLLRAIYRPQNFYCIHVDTKMAPRDQKALSTIAGCFENVFLATRSINVTWGEYTVLEAELICMEDLLQKKAWKYFINLTGQEYPLKTNREIVKILEAMNGDNIVDGAVIRASQKYFYRWTNAGGPPPHNVRPFKGAVHVAVNRDFVEFCLYDNRAQDLLRWLKQTDISDESFFASLNYNAHLKAPGGFQGTPDEVPRKPAFTRYKRWRPSNSTGIRECYGKYVHDVCVLGIGDLARAYKHIGLFVNKLYLDFEYLAFDCLEEVLYKKTWQEYLSDAQINVTIKKQPEEITYLLTHKYDN